MQRGNDRRESHDSCRLSSALSGVNRNRRSLYSANESKPSPIQQTASGAGVVNVGRDAVINNNITKSAGEEAAERVQACGVQHGLKTASKKSESLETTPATNTEPGKTIDHITFRACTWPRSSSADGDGYLEIKVQSVDGPGDNDPSGIDLADRIVASCHQLTVAYQFGHMGAYENQTPFTISADTLVTVDGKSWINEISNDHLRNPQGHETFGLTHGF